MMLEHHQQTKNLLVSYSPTPSASSEPMTHLTPAGST